jgi:integrase/recombinase XerD
VFRSRLTRTHLTVNGVLRLVKRTKKRAGLDKEISPHWLLHAHASHALDRGASLAQVQSTSGHASASTTSIYLHARPEDSSGLRLDESVRA